MGEVGWEVPVEGAHTVTVAVGDSVLEGWHPWSLMCKVPFRSLPVSQVAWGCRELGSRPCVVPAMSLASHPL